VNSTISLEGIVRWHSKLESNSQLVRYGCFDWDPFGSFLPGNVGMIEQDVTTMLTKAFELIGNPNSTNPQILVPCKLRVF
jgi:LacI family fructose operon transcriptional repressor